MNVMKTCVYVYMRMVLPEQYVIGGIFAKVGLEGQFNKAKGMMVTLVFLVTKKSHLK